MLEIRGSKIICQRFTSSIGASKQLIISSPVDQHLIIRELSLIIDIASIKEIPVYSEDPMLSDDQRNALFWTQAVTAPSKRIVTWFGTNEAQPIRLIEFFIFNRRPYYLENLLQRFTGTGELQLEPNQQIYFSIEPTNTGLLSAQDSLTVWGQSNYATDR